MEMEGRGAASCQHGPANKPSLTMHMIYVQTVGVLLRYRNGTNVASDHGSGEVEVEWYGTISSLQ